MNNHSQYYQIRFIDEKSHEIVRVDSYGSNTRVVPEKELQNMSQDPYFTETMKLKKREIYYSEVNLDREHNRLQVPHAPLFRIATPVYDVKDRVRGVLVIKIYATYLFENITPESGGSGNTLSIRTATSLFTLTNPKSSVLIRAQNIL